MHLKSVAFHPDTYPTRDRYPFNLPIYQHTQSLFFSSPVTLFVGENGTGKSTLLEALARLCDIYIWRDENRRRFHYDPVEEAFHRFLSIEWTTDSVPGAFFASSIFQHFAQLLDEWAANDPGQLDYFGGRSLIAQSHGQSLMSFFNSRCQRRGVYLLDEPETALSPRSQLALLEFLVTTVNSLLLLIHRSCWHVRRRLSTVLTMSGYSKQPMKRRHTINCIKVFWMIDTDICQRFEAKRHLSQSTLRTQS